MSVFLGKPPASIEQWIKEHVKPSELETPLCFTAVDAGATITFNKVGSLAAARIKYATESSGQRATLDWQPYTFKTTITLANVGDKVYFRAANENNISFYKDSNNYYRFATTAGKRISASGNIQTLMKADGSRLDISGKNYCYWRMFYNCTSLAAAPALPATTLADSCYSGMFQGCTSLTSAPELPATTLATYCYNNMFRDCTHLSSINVGFTAWSPSDATPNWVNGVAASGTFTCPEDLPHDSGNVGTSKIPSGWTVMTK